MHRFSAPIALETVTDETFPAYVSQFRAAGVDRVLICGIGEIKASNGPLFEDPSMLARNIAAFRAEGFEVCAWLNAFGHGAVLAHAADSDEEAGGFAHIVGLDGRHSKHGLCPTDPNFRAHYAACLQKVAAMHPDMIMLDDDFRLNVRDATYDVACFCSRHLAALYRELGEEIPLDVLRKRLFVGGKNKYRSAWMKVMGESLLSFAREMRAAVDAVDPTVRLSACMCYDTWDMDGIDGLALARAFAGNTAPFLRTIGAPYHDIRVGATVESTRMQAAWCKDSGIEIFAEGDVYPRPRYNVPASSLELFDLALLACGAVDGDQKYMFDYVRRVGFENGYVAHHLKNAPLREGICDLFAKKRPIGVRVFEAMHKVEAWDLPEQTPNGVAIGRYLHKGFHSRAARFLAELSVPTAYDESSYPVAVFGENARHIPLDVLKNGAILDVTAAKLLAARGVDVGLISSAPQKFQREYFIENDDTIGAISAVPLEKMELAPTAKVLSLLQPGDAPGAYLYENADGLRFYVLAEDSYGRLPTPVREYHNSYYRQQQLMDAVEWVAKKPLPVRCEKNPYLYAIAAKGEGDAMAVALFNVFEDAILSPTILLDKPYNGVRFVNCTGELKGNVLTLSDVAPFGTAAFEVF